MYSLTPALLRFWLMKPSDGNAGTPEIIFAASSGSGGNTVPRFGVQSTNALYRAQSHLRATPKPTA